jgi:hypothetical protein
MEFWHYQNDKDENGNLMTWAEAMADLGGKMVTVDPDRTDRLISLNDRGPLVRELEDQLFELGYLNPSEVDGIFDSDTEHAVMTFQRDRKLTVDGKAGKDTLAAIRKAIDKQNSAAVPDPPVESSVSNTPPVSTDAAAEPTIQQTINTAPANPDPAVAPAPVEGGGPNDPPVKVIDSSKITRMLTPTAIGNALAGVWAAMNGKWLYVLLFFLLATTAVLAWVARKTILDALRGWLFADGQKINIK